jgi:hypothetical protein
MLRIFFVGLAIVAALVAAKREHWLARAGLVGTCQVSQPPFGDTAQWWSCKQGILTGFPVLTRHDCDSKGFVASREVWRCPTPLVQAPGAV